MKKILNKRTLGYMALALVCVMLGSGMTLLKPHAEAENVVVVTSPFTAAVDMVRDSVVGVSNYQMVRVGGNGNGYYGGFDPFSFFGFGNYGFGNYGYGNYGQQEAPKSEEVEYSTGSGVVVAPGYVMTNYHVVSDASALKITVAADAEEEAKIYDAVLVAKDENLDVAVLYVDGLDLPAVELGDSDTLRVGDWAICIGNPLNKKFAGTVTAGIVSGLDREITKNTTTDKYGRKTTVTNSMIQVDAAINSGNSGGGMFNTQGQLMGIPTMKYSGSAYGTTASIESIGMCIPINAAKPVIEEALANKDKVMETVKEEKKEEETAEKTDILHGKPRMGVTVTGLNSNSTAIRNGVLPMGIYVKEVQENSPAAYAGMQHGDIIVDLDDTVVTSVSQMQQIIENHAEGDVVKVKVYRVEGGLELDATTIGDGEYVDLELTLAVVDDVIQ